MKRTVAFPRARFERGFTMPENYRAVSYLGQPVAAVALDNQTPAPAANPAYIDLLDGIALVMVGVPFHKGIAKVERFLRSNGEARSILKAALPFIPAGEIKNAIQRS